MSDSQEHIRPETRQQQDQKAQANLVSDAAEVSSLQRKEQAPPLQLSAEKPIQRAEIETSYGTFKDAQYTNIRRGGRNIGVSMDLEFHPGTQVNSPRIGMVQAIKTMNEGESQAWHPLGMEQRDESTGFRIDQDDDRRSPVYTANYDDPANTEMNQVSVDNRFGEDGKRVPGDTEIKAAKLHDEPQSYFMANSGQYFESTAISMDGPQEGMYYGSVRWGYEIDSSGSFRKLPLTLISNDAPSEAFMGAAEAWNESQARGSIQTTGDPTRVYRNTNFNSSFTVPAGTRVIRLGNNSTWRDDLYFEVMMAGGEHNGDVGYVKLAHLQDQQDGAETIDLPTVAPVYEGPHDDILDIPPAAQVPYEARVRLLDDSDNMTAYIQVLSGDHAGVRGYVSKLGGLPFTNVERAS